MLMIAFGKASFKRCFPAAIYCHGGAKLVRVMKLTIVLLTVVCLHTTANGFAQGITLNEKNAPVEKVFKEITRQTGYVFFYVDGLLNNAKKVTVVTTNSSLDKTLSICFSQLPFSYSIVEKTIVVSEKTQSPPPQPTQ